MGKPNSWFLFASPFLVAALIAGIGYLRDNNTITSMIAVFPTQSARERAALSRLSQDIKQHPDVNTFIIEDGVDLDSRPYLFKYMRVAKDNQFIVGPNKSVFIYYQRIMGQRYGAVSCPFPLEAIHETAKLQGDLKTLHRVIDAIHQRKGLK